MPRFRGAGGEALRQAHVTQKFFDEPSHCTCSEHCTHTAGNGMLAHATSTADHINFTKLETMLKALTPQEAERFMVYMVCENLSI